MYQQEIIDHYSGTGYEDDRLSTGISRLEYIRTQEVIGRYLYGGPLVILDVGGGTGPYAFWLAAQGHTVHLIDLVPRHIAIAQKRAQTANAKPASIEVGEARSLPYPDNYADLILLMGPLYHLVKEEERLDALREAGRVLKPGARLLCAAISRYAPLLDGFRAYLFDDPLYQEIVDQDLHDGQHRNPDPQKSYFTTAYLHRPEELRVEIGEAGLTCEKVIGVEGPLCVTPELDQWLDERGRTWELVLKYAKALEEEESILGASFHLLAIARKP
jgi:ubiquinone/menaquinone biosynthesis C-methylase UbiE